MKGTHGHGAGGAHASQAHSSTGRRGKEDGAAKGAACAGPNQHSQESSCRVDICVCRVPQWERTNTPRKRRARWHLVIVDLHALEHIEWTHARVIGTLAQL